MCSKLCQSKHPPVHRCLFCANRVERLGDVCSDCEGDGRGDAAFCELCGGPCRQENAPPAPRDRIEQRATG